MTIDHPAGRIDTVIDDVPSVRELRWPVMVVLDGLGEDEILDLEDRVALRVGLSDGARAIVDPETGRALITQRLMQAIEDLYQAGAIEPDVEAGSIRITGFGKRLSEADAAALPEGAEGWSSGSADKKKISTWDAVLAVLDGLIH